METILKESIHTFRDYYGEDHFNSCNDTDRTFLTDINIHVRAMVNDIGGRWMTMIYSSITTGKFYNPSTDTFTDDVSSVFNN